MVHEYGTWIHSCMTTWKTGSNRFSFTKVEISNRKTFANVLFHSGDDWSFCQLNLSTKVFQFQVGNRKPSVYAWANWEPTENCSFLWHVSSQWNLDLFVSPCRGRCTVAECGCSWGSRPALPEGGLNTVCVEYVCVCITGCLCQEDNSICISLQCSCGSYDCLHGGGLYQQALH